MVTRPVVLDFFCGAGGCSVGYHRAGFRVVGIDIEYQPNYPYEQITSDIQAPGLIAELVGHYRPTLLHGSPPCQLDSRLRHYQPDVIDAKYPDLIGWTREAFLVAGLPFVIENVETARRKLRNPIRLCGSQFPELEVVRHRLFEADGFMVAEPAHSNSRHRRCVRNGYLPDAGQWMTISGGKHSIAWQRRACQAMGTPWMQTVREVCESVPPAYTEYVGRVALAQIPGRVAA